MSDLPIKAARVLKVQRVLQELEESFDDGSLYRITGFFKENLRDSTGFSVVLSTSGLHGNKYGAISENIIIGTKKIIPWPEDIRPGDVVQVTGHLDRESEFDVNAVSIIKLEEINTEKELDMLNHSYLNVLKFLEEPRVQVLSSLESCSMQATGTQIQDVEVAQTDYVGQFLAFSSEKKQNNLKNNTNESSSFSDSKSNGSKSPLDSAASKTEAEQSDTNAESKSETSSSQESVYNSDPESWKAKVPIGKGTEYNGEFSGRARKAQVKQMQKL